MASDSNDGTAVTVVLGDEFDDALRAKLMDALRTLGATPVGTANRVLAGSQDFEQFDVLVDGHALHVEAETYIGLSISGLGDIVQRVQALVGS